MGFTSFNSVAGAVTLSPTADTRNVLQPSAQTVRPLTIRAPATLQKDLLRIEGSSGTPWLRFGSGPWDNVPVEMASAPGSMSLFVRAAYDGAGFIGSSTDDGTNRLYFTGGVNVAAGAGPHLFFDTGRGRPATEYWYTELLHKHNDKHVFASGIESYSATQKHYFETVVPTESPFTVIYNRTVDWQTGRQIINPGATFPATYGSLVEMRSEAVGVPVLTLTAKASQTADMVRVNNSDATTAVRIGKGGIAGEAAGLSSTDPSLVVRSVSNSGGYIGARSSDGAHESFFTALALTGSGAGPRSIKNQGIGRPTSEYWYTQDGYQHNSVGVFDHGIESYSSTAKHYYETVNLSGGAVRYVRTVDWATGRTLLNPGSTFPATYTHALDIRSEAAAVPVVRVMAAGSQSADLQTWCNASTGIESRVDKTGYFMTRRSAAPADADLANGEGALWIDTSTGNLKWKSKTSGGTVVTRTLTTA